MSKKKEDMDWMINIVGVILKYLLEGVQLLAEDQLKTMIPRHEWREKKLG